MPIREMEDKRGFNKVEFKELAFIDELTSLYNRQYLYQYLPKELSDMRHLDKKLSLFMMDIDNFKQLNDKYGYLYGDRILVKVAKILNQSFRGADTVVRYAGDTFVVILPGADEVMAIDISQRIIKKINRNNFAEGRERPNIHLTISIGLAFYPSDAGCSEKLIYWAEQALYLSKRSGGNCICTTKDITSHMLDEKSLELILPSKQLIGHREQLHRLKELSGQIKKGHFKLVLISGARGSGKTRLFVELKRYLQSKQMRCVNVCCLPDTTNQPYQVLIAVLQELFATISFQSDAFVQSIPENQMLQLAYVIPAIKQAFSSESKTVKITSPRQRRIDLLQGICQSLIYFLKDQSIVLLIDNFHWIDKWTLQFFSETINKVNSLPILVVGAYCKDEIEESILAGAAKEILRHIKRNQLVEELELEPLKKVELLQMVETVFPGLQIGSAVGDIIYGLSAGNPLFIEEILRDLFQEGTIFYEGGKWYFRQINRTAFTQSLEEAIQKRIAGLDEEVKTVIFAAAVIGELFDTRILSQVLERDSGYVLDILDAATKQYLIMPIEHFQVDRFRFRSGYIREIIYRGLSVERRQKLHIKLASVQEQLNKYNIDFVAASLSYHFYQGKNTKKAGFYEAIVEKNVQLLPYFHEVIAFLKEVQNESF
jgi:diguanylate cyclase (GGDEF)-like protein